MRGAFRTKIACSTTDCNLKTQPLRDFHADKSAIRRTPDLPLVTNLTFPIGYILAPSCPLLRFAKEKMGLELTWIALAASLLMAFGTKRTGPDLSHVGGKYDTQWHRTHFRNPRDLVPGSILPPFPWIANNEEEFQALVAYLQRLGRAKNWRPDNDYEK